MTPMQWCIQMFCHKSERTYVRKFNVNILTWTIMRDRTKLLLDLFKLIYGGGEHTV